MLTVLLDAWAWLGYCLPGFFLAVFLRSVCVHNDSPTRSVHSSCARFFAPCFQLWRLPFAQVLFDSDPADKQQNKDTHTQAEEMSQAMIRWVWTEAQCCRLTWREGAATQPHVNCVCMGGGGGVDSRVWVGRCRCVPVHVFFYFYDHPTTTTTCHTRPQ